MDIPTVNGGVWTDSTPTITAAPGASTTILVMPMTDEMRDEVRRLVREEVARLLTQGE